MSAGGFLLLVINLQFIFFETAANPCPRYNIPKDLDLNSVRGLWEIKQTISHQNGSRGGKVAENDCNTVNVELNDNGDMTITWNGQGPKVYYKGKVNVPDKRSIWKVTGPFRETRSGWHESQVPTDSSHATIPKHPVDSTDLDGVFHVLKIDENNILLNVCLETSKSDKGFTELLTKENARSAWESRQVLKDIDQFFRLAELEKVAVEKTCNGSGVTMSSFLILQILLVAVWKISI